MGAHYVNQASSSDSWPSLHRCRKLVSDSGPDGCSRLNVHPNIGMKTIARLMPGPLAAYGRSLAVAVACLALASALRAQDAPTGPMAPAPDHHVTRISNIPTPEAPPSLPEDQIIKGFTQKEDEFVRARTHYTYKKTIRIEEFGPDGQPSGEYVVVSQPARNPDGTFYEKVLERPQTTLTRMHLLSEDLDIIQRMPAYPLTTAQLPKYNVKYIGKEKVDEVDCYLFQVKPKLPERATALFDGVVWVDDKHLEVVKTYGRWITDLGVMKSKTLPFTMFETYREFVGEKYWFPVYARSDDTATIDKNEFPIRIVIKYSDFKPVAAPPAATNASPAPPTTKPPAGKEP